MEAFKYIMESRMRDKNPFREMLQKMGAFGGPNLQEVGGVPPPTGVPNLQGPNIQKLVAMLIAKGVPRDQAIQQAQQMAQQQGGGMAPGV